MAAKNRIANSAATERYFQLENVLHCIRYVLCVQFYAALIFRMDFIFTQWIVEHIHIQTS